MPKKDDSLEFEKKFNQNRKRSPSILGDYRDDFTLAKSNETYATLSEEDISSLIRSAKIEHKIKEDLEASKLPGKIILVRGPIKKDSKKLDFEPDHKPLTSQEKIEITKKTLSSKRTQIIPTAKTFKKTNSVYKSAIHFLEDSSISNNSKLIILKEIKNELYKFKVIDSHLEPTKSFEKGEINQSYKKLRNFFGSVSALSIGIEDNINLIETSIEDKIRENQLILKESYNNGYVFQTDDRDNVKLYNFAKQLRDKLFSSYDFTKNTKELSEEIVTEVEKSLSKDIEIDLASPSLKRKLLLAVNALESTSGKKPGIIDKFTSSNIFIAGEVLKKALYEIISEVNDQKSLTKKPISKPKTIDKKLKTETLKIDTEPRSPSSSIASTKSFESYGFSEEDFEVMSRLSDSGMKHEKNEGKKSFSLPQRVAKIKQGKSKNIR